MSHRIDSAWEWKRQVSAYTAHRKQLSKPHTFRAHQRLSMHELGARHECFRSTHAKAYCAFSVENDGGSGKDVWTGTSVVKGVNFQHAFTHWFEYSTIHSSQTIDLDNLRCTHEIYIQSKIIFYTFFEHWHTMGIAQAARIRCAHHQFWRRGVDLSSFEVIPHKLLTNKKPLTKKCI